MPFLKHWFLWVVSVLSIASLNSQAEPRLIEIGVIPEKMRFDTEWIGVEPGESIRLRLINTCRMQHNLVVCQPGPQVTMRVAQAAWLLGDEAIERAYIPDHPDVFVGSGLVNPGGSGELVFKAPETVGDYPYVCTLPGHALTMKGILHVGDRGDAPTPKSLQRESVPAAAVERAKQKMKIYRPLMDGGPVVAGIVSGKNAVDSLGSPKPFRTVNRGLVIRLGDRREAAVLFDTELLAFVCGWTGEHVGFLEGREDERAEYRYEPGGPLHYWMPESVGWASSEGHWQDPRERRLGHLPKKWGHYLGREVEGETVTLNYAVHGVTIKDRPWYRPGPVFGRTLRIEPSSRRLSLRLASSQQATCSVSVTNDEWVELTNTDGHWELEVKPRDKVITVDVALSRGTMAEPSSAPQTRNRPPRSPTIVTTGILGKSDGPFVVDTLTLPYENPWNALLYTGGFDFFGNGDAAVCTSHGDVWLVSGIDESLARLEWRRFATGLANPLGLKIVDDQVYVASLHEITRLHDSDDNGVADYYECFNAEGEVSSSHHRFVTDLQTDTDGNFYYLKCTDEGHTAHGGSVIRVSKDGQDFELFATGLRNPNGLGMGPGDLMTFGKQQGTWIPTSAIQVVEKGGFYGYMRSHHRGSEPSDFDRPLCWIPHGIDNSSSCQVWAPQTGPWRPLAGEMFHFSYGKCQMFLVLPEQIDGTYQGGIVSVPGIEFESGAMRARFREKDGQLYVMGLRGWQTTAAMPGSFQRVRYTGEPLTLPKALRIESRGVRLVFREPLDRGTAMDVSRFTVEKWQYRWTKNYGSSDYKISDPDQKGRDSVVLKGLVLSEDQQSLLLVMDDLEPVMQMGIGYDLRTQNGTLLKGEIYQTIHKIPGP